MSQRYRVLISAYACEPNKGSEPEVGWQWALQMARFHDVTVLTRANNRAAIEPALRTLPADQLRPDFVYHDLSPALMALKKMARITRYYYVLWQKSASQIVARLHQTRPFDLLHHVTFATFRYPTVIWGHGAPTVWGPVGGMESVPLSLLPWSQPASLLHETLRNLNNRPGKSAPNLRRRAAQSTTVLASTRAMQEALSDVGFESELMPTIGLNPAEFGVSSRPLNQSHPLKLLYVGNIITLKGLDLALEALKLSGVRSTFTLIGDGSYCPALKRKAAALGLSGHVQFLGRIPRQDVLRRYSDFDLFVFPSLHDTGGYAVIEAMCNKMPVVCLDCGGPAVAVADGCGIRIPVGSRPEIISALASAFRLYNQNRSTLQTHGSAAWARILAEYDWRKKAEQMDRVYRQTVGEFSKRETPVI